MRTKTQLDLCCGKAEMLCQWSHRWGIHGTGVDISATFLKSAKQRATELGVDDRIILIEADASHYQPTPQSFDIISCIGATWIGGGLVGTLKHMQPALKSDGILLVGEPYWIAPPTDTICKQIEVSPQDFTSLVGTLDRIESVGLELVEMVLADQDSWDRGHVASQWLTVDNWLRANPQDPDAAELRAWNAHHKRSYLEYQREYLGWGIFVARMK